MLVIIDIDEEHYNYIKYKVDQGNTEFYPYVVIAKGKPLSEVLYTNSWEEHVNMLKGIYNDK